MNLKQWLKKAIFVLSLIILAFPADSQLNDERGFDRQKLEEYKNDPAFDYSQEYAQTESGLGYILLYLYSKIAEFFSKPGLEWVGPIIFRILLAAGIITAILLIVRLRFKNAFHSYSSNFYSPTVSYSNHQDEDYQKLLNESLKNNDFQLAVRYLFLSTLQVMEAKKHIRITKWKAPYDYLKEIPEGKKPGFKNIVDLFENSWYGDYNPDEKALQAGMNDFQQLKDE